MLNAAIFIILCIIWGSTWLAIKIGLEGSPPFLGAGFRFGISAAFLLLIAVISRRKIFAFGEKWPQVLVAAFLIYPIPYSLVYWGSQYIETGMAAVLFAAMPFFVAILAHLFIPRERLTFLKVLGMIIGFAGIFIIFGDNLGAEKQFGVLGMAAIVLSSFFSSSGTIISKIHFRDIDPLSLTVVQSAIGCLILTAVGLIAEPISSYNTDPKTVGSLLYLGIFGTALAFTLYFYVLKKMEATKLATIAFITPVVALLLGVMIRNERFDPLSVVGSAMVILGVFVVVAGDNLLRRRAVHSRS
jgi:drug/metabolite transporter (DMT)-like permease